MLILMIVLVLLVFAWGIWPDYPPVDSLQDMQAQEACDELDISMASLMTIEAYERERFLRDHHYHLISPFMYTADQLALKNRWLLMVTWHRFTPRAEPVMIGSG